MLKLRGKVDVVNATRSNPILVNITRNPELPTPLRKKTALLLKGMDLARLTPEFVGQLRIGVRFAALLFCGNETELAAVEMAARGLHDVYLLPGDYAYLDEGDILRLNPIAESISSVFRKVAPNNTILLTERCNHLCLMCSQPPKSADDSWLLDEAFELVRMIPLDTENIGFSGGEPSRCDGVQTLGCSVRRRPVARLTRPTSSV